jgi:hypothetical protein
MKVQLEVKIKDFTVPNYVIEQTEGEELGRSIPLSALDSNTLAAMCEEFTRQVFEKAGKQRPPGCA